MTDKAALPDAWSPFGKPRGTRDPELNYLEKGMGLMALTGRRPAEIFFSASFSLPPKKLPFPAIIFDGQLKTRHAPGTTSSLIRSRSSPIQKRSSARSINSGP